MVIGKGKVGKLRKYRHFLNRNTSGDGFCEAIKGEYFVDKSLLIAFTNQKLSTKEKWICVSKPRRFGKTFALEMLDAYYTKNGNAEELFHGLGIKRTVEFYKHLNKHNVISINFAKYFENYSPCDGGIELLSRHLTEDLKAEYSDVVEDGMDLSLAFDMIQQEKGEKFIFLIDEWDSIFRYRKGRKKEQEEFLGFLKDLFKDRAYVELVYMTGILPIKKYNTGSALNMFREYTTIDPKSLGRFFGFSKEELSRLCQKIQRVSMEELTEWYDGYYVEGVGEMYNPKSVTEALGEGICKDYWNKTGGFTELEEYITLNFEGLRDDIIHLLTGEKIPLNVVGFSNDLESFQDKEEVLTALIHLGYLTYREGFVSIPNKELREEFSSTVKRLNWGIVSKLLMQSKKLLNATLQLDEGQVAQLLEDVHDGMQELKEYNNEHTLKCVIHLAYYAAADLYEFFFEAPAGKGYADCVMRPRNSGYPGIIMELKYNKTVEEGMLQIEEKKYMDIFARTGVKEAVLAAVNYDKKTKKHQCRMKKVFLG